MFLSIFQFHRSSVSRLFSLSSAVYFTTRFIFATIVTMISVFMARSICYTDGIEITLFGFYFSCLSLHTYTMASLHCCREAVTKLL